MLYGMPHIDGTVHPDPPVTGCAVQSLGILDSTELLSQGTVLGCLSIRTPWKVSPAYGIIMPDIVSLGLVVAMAHILHPDLNGLFLTSFQAGMPPCTRVL